MWEPQFNGYRVPYGGDENVLELGMLQWLHNIVNVLSPMENFMVYVFYHNGKIKYKNFKVFFLIHPTSFKLGDLCGNTYHTPAKEKGKPEPTPSL